MNDSSSVQNGIFDYNVGLPLIRELVLNTIVDEPEIRMDLTSAKSFFTGATLLDTNFLTSNLHYGDTVKINLRKQLDPNKMVTKSKLERKSINECHSRLDMECGVPCLNYLPQFDCTYMTLDTKYAVGVRKCVTDDIFWDQTEYTRQYAKSVESYRFVREVDLWNRIIRNLIATPADTRNPQIAACEGKETHYWSNLGKITEKGARAIKEAYWYQSSAYKVNAQIFMTPEAANELVDSVQNPYNLNQTTQLVNTFKDWDIPGFNIANAVSQILGGLPVQTMQHSVWMDAEDGSTTEYPLWAEDKSKQYVAILDPRVGYDIEVAGYKGVEVPNGCAHPYAGITDIYYVGGGITFNQYGMVLAFDMSDFCL